MQDSENLFVVATSVDALLPDGLDSGKALGRAPGAPASVWERRERRRTKKQPFSILLIPYKCRHFWASKSPRLDNARCALLASSLLLSSLFRLQPNLSQVGTSIVIDVLGILWNFIDFRKISTVSFDFDRCPLQYNRFSLILMGSGFVQEF